MFFAADNYLVKLFTLYSLSQKSTNIYKPSHRCPLLPVYPAPPPPKLEFNAL